MASAFLDAGCDWYIAPVEDPDGAAAHVFAVNFVYNYFCRDLSVAVAVSASQNENDDSRFFALYERPIAEG